MASIFFEYKIDEGVVTKKEAGKLSVSLSSDEKDQSCSDKKSDCGGGCCNCVSTNKATKIIIPVEKESIYSIGERIQFRHYTPNPAVVAMIIFGIPILCAFISLFLWYHFSPSKAESPLAVFTAGVSFCFGFVIVWSIDRLFRKAFPAALIVRKNSSDTLMDPLV